MISGDFTLRSGDREKSSKSGELTGMAIRVKARCEIYLIRELPVVGLVNT